MPASLLFRAPAPTAHPAMASAPAPTARPAMTSAPDITAMLSVLYCAAYGRCDEDCDLLQVSRVQRVCGMGSRQRSAQLVYRTRLWLCAVPTHVWTNPLMHTCVHCFASAPQSINLFIQSYMFFIVPACRYQGFNNTRVWLSLKGGNLVTGEPCSGTPEDWYQQVGTGNYGGLQSWH